MAWGELEVGADRAENGGKVGGFLGDQRVGALALALRAGLAEVVGGVGLRV